MNKLFNFKHIKALIILAMLPLFAFAEGGSAGGGGGGIVCGIASGMTTSVTHTTLYDLYDQRPGWPENLTLIKSNESAQVQLESAINRIDDEFMRELVKETLNNMLITKKWLKPGQKFKSGTDFGNQEAPVVPEGCDFRPIGYYFAKGYLVIDPELYFSMDETNKAAFFMHEALYYIARTDSYQTDSTEVREVVAGLFSHNSVNFRLRERVMKLYLNGWTENQTRMIVDTIQNTTSVEVSISNGNHSSSADGNIKCNLHGYHHPSADNNFNVRGNGVVKKEFSGLCQKIDIVLTSYFSENANLLIKFMNGSMEHKVEVLRKQFSRLIMIQRQKTPVLPLQN